DGQRPSTRMLSPGANRIRQIERYHDAARRRTMHRHLAAAALAVSTMITSAPAAAQTRGADRPTDSAAIRAHIERICQAFVDKDRARLEATHGAEWRGFTPWSGHVIR